MAQKKILIIEDDLILLNLLKDKLTKAGYNITSAENGKLGLKMAQVDRPDLILLDLILPEMDGMTILEKIRADSSISSMPIIIISNSGQPFEIEKAEKMGIEDYLVKTEFDPGEVLKKVDKFFKKTRNGKVENYFEADDAIKPEENKNEKIIDSNPEQTSVLIIEDDRFLRELISQKLEKERIKTILAITAEEALALLKKERPHLILLDLILPGMSGFEFLEKLRTDPNLSDIPVIVLSNLGEKKDKETAMNLGAKSFLVRAMNSPNEIVEEVKRVLEKSYL